MSLDPPEILLSVPKDESESNVDAEWWIFINRIINFNINIDWIYPDNQIFKII